MTSSHLNRGRPVFCLALNGWPRRTIFGILSSFVRRTCPSHLNLSFIIAVESGTEPHFLNSLLFEIRSVTRGPRIIRRQFLWKTFSKSSSIFGAPMLQSRFQLWKNTLILGFSTFKIFTAPTFFTEKGNCPPDQSSRYPTLPFHLCLFLLIFTFPLFLFIFNYPN